MGVSSCEFKSHSPHQHKADNRAVCGQWHDAIQKVSKSAQEARIQRNLPNTTDGFVILSARRKQLMKKHTIYFALLSIHPAVKR